MGSSCLIRAHPVVLVSADFGLMRSSFRVKQMDMKKTLGFVAAFVLLAVVVAAVVGSRKMGRQPDGSVLIPTGQRLTPAGQHIEVSDRPLGMTASPDGRLLAVATGQQLRAATVSTSSIRGRRSLHQTIPIGDSFVGVAFDRAASRLYVGGGRDHDVKVFERQDDGTFRQATSIKIPDSAPSGLALSGRWPDALCCAEPQACPGGDRHREPAGRRRSRWAASRTRSPSARKIYVSNWGGRRPRSGGPDRRRLPGGAGPSRHSRERHRLGDRPATQGRPAAHRRGAASERHGAQPAARPAVCRQRQQRSDFGDRHPDGPGGRGRSTCGCTAMRRWAARRTRSRSAGTAKRSMSPTGRTTRWPWSRPAEGREPGAGLHSHRVVPDGRRR